jgi:hypothetical protein
VGQVEAATPFNENIDDASEGTSSGVKPDSISHQMPLL